MTLIELFAPEGALDAQRRRQVAERLATELLRADGAPPAVIERARRLTWVIVHEPDAWAVGGQPADALGAPRYLVRVTVPGGHLSEAMRAELIARVTRAVAEGDDDLRRLHREPDLWVHVVELPDGDLGAFGRIVRSADVTRMVVTGKRPAEADPRGAAALVDPICGMTVEPGPSAITHARDGTTHAFCSASCRDLFVARGAVRAGHS